MLSIAMIACKCYLIIIDYILISYERRLASLDIWVKQYMLTMTGIAVARGPGGSKLIMK
jgi:hypothetical protein